MGCRVFLFFVSEFNDAAGCRDVPGFLAKLVAISILSWIAKSINLGENESAKTSFCLKYLCGL